MNRYTIYCTEEQTKKAFELGAPIEASKDHSNGNVGDKLCVYHDIVNKDEWGVGECTILRIPTVEQMIGWLQEKTGFTTWHINYYPVYEMYGYLIIHKDVVIEKDSSEHGKFLCTNYKEATLAAIDAMLEYLSNK